MTKTNDTGDILAPSGEEFLADMARLQELDLLSPEEFDPNDRFAWANERYELEREMVSRYAGRRALVTVDVPADDTQPSPIELVEYTTRNVITPSSPFAVRFKREIRKAQREMNKPGSHAIEGKISPDWIRDMAPVFGIEPDSKRRAFIPGHKIHPRFASDVRIEFVDEGREIPKE